MSEFPNIARLDQIDPDKLTMRQVQIHMIRQDYEAKHPVSPSSEKTARMAAAVPALLAHINELYGQLENLRKYAETTKYHQDQHDAAVRELETVRAELVHLAGPLAEEDRPNASIEDLLIAVGGDLKHHRSELQRVRAEVVQIAIDTSPAYAQLRDERDSARRERDEAMAKLDALRGTAETEPRPQAGDHVRGTDLDGVVRVGELIGFFAWSNEEQKNTRARVNLADGTQAVVHTESLVVLKAGAQ